MSQFTGIHSFARASLRYNFIPKIVSITFLILELYDNCQLPPNNENILCLSYDGMFSVSWKGEFSSNITLTIPKYIHFMKKDKAGYIRIALSLSLCILFITVLAIPQIRAVPQASTPECGGEALRVCFAVGCHEGRTLCASLTCARCILIAGVVSTCFSGTHICWGKGGGSGGGVTPIHPE